MRTTVGNKKMPELLHPSRPTHRTPGRRHGRRGDLQHVEAAQDSSFTIATTAMTTMIDLKMIGGSRRPTLAPT